MQIDLTGRTALVTGASKGIGRATAAALASAGAQVMLSSRKQDALDEAAATMDGVTATFVANAGEPDQAEACVTATIERFGAVDILVNNAATNPYMGATIDIDLPRHDKTWQVNFRGPLVWSRLVWDGHMKEHGGVIVNVASIGGLSVEPTIGIYNTTKAALIHLTKTLAAEMGPHGVRVNAVAPGLVKTDMARALWEPAEESFSAHLPLRRLGEPEDIASAIAFLSSDLASWITGQTLVVDGGALVTP